jgi:hypothetical protein
MLTMVPIRSSGIRFAPRRRHKQPPDLAYVVIDDRLSAVEPQLRDHLTDVLAREPVSSLSSR